VAGPSDWLLEDTGTFAFTKGRNGVADADMTAVMGSGMQLRAENAYPRREALRSFALADALSAAFRPASFGGLLRGLQIPIVSLTSVWPARMQRHYPRTAAEVQAGQMITTRPHRGA